MKNKAKLRKALYGVAIAVSPVLVLQGIINTAEEAVYLGVVDSLLALAFYNVDDSGDVGE